MNLPSTMRAVVLTGHGGLDKLEYREDWPTACGRRGADQGRSLRPQQHRHQHSHGLVPGAASALASRRRPAAPASSKPRLTPAVGERGVAISAIQGADVAGRIAAAWRWVDNGRVGEGHRRIRGFSTRAIGWTPAMPPISARNAMADLPDYNDRLRRQRAPHRQPAVRRWNWLPSPVPTPRPRTDGTCLKPGESVLIAGASRSSAAVQLCRLRGACVIAIASRSKGGPAQGAWRRDQIDRAMPEQPAIHAAAGGAVDVA